MTPQCERPPTSTAEPEAKDADADVPVVPEAGEGPYPPVTGEPKPPIGN
ncbi:hypothetical protein [Mycobacterium palustre]|nr:hypothetical protein [Mycobacterium palustre]MCV7100750.1 hypothetical protein [Mycobacterium palustre]